MQTDESDRAALHLEAVRDHTAPLPEKLTTINGALGALLGGLEAADRHLHRAGVVFGLR